MRVKYWQYGEVDPEGVVHDLEGVPTGLVVDPRPGSTVGEDYLSVRTGVTPHRSVEGITLVFQTPSEKERFLRLPDVVADMR